MRKSYAHSLELWPLRKNGEPIFTCTEDAVYYGHLVFDKIEKIDHLRRLRKKAYLDIAMLRAKKKVDYQRIFDLAVRAQFYRECMEEIQRINNGKFELPGGE